MKSKQQHIFWIAGLLVLWLLAIASRGVILHANEARLDGALPFTLESALQFRMTERVYEGRGIPSHDPMIQFPDGIDVFKTDTVLAEYVYGYLARLLPGELPLPLRVRWIMIVWFSLSAPLVAAWVFAWTRSRSAGFIAGAFFAVSLATVIRSSGLEISRENFAFPFLIAHLWLHAWRESESGPRPIWAVIGSALGLGMALLTWDMIQYYAALWVIVWCVRVFRGAGDALREQWRWGAPAAGLVLVAWLSPYHRSHGLWMSPTLLLVYGLLLRMAVQHVRHAPRWRGIAAMAVPWGLFALVPHGYRANYGHFAELLVAKIRFLNVKPMDPSLLTFNQRIMWVPALDSATWSLTWILFPATHVLIVVASGLAVMGWRKRRDASSILTRPTAAHIFFFLILSVLAYILFVRFHIYLGLFACAWLGGCWASVREQRSWTVYLFAALLAVGWAVEAARVWEEPGRWGRPNVYYRELQELTDWLRHYGNEQPVLANFGVSASILAYGNCPIVLHPKFETPEIRERVEQYGRKLFTGDERAFRDWADQHGAYYFVYALGEFYPHHVELQMRYFVDAVEPPETAPARLFEYDPHAARYFEFKEEASNTKYRLFRIRSRDDERLADQHTIFARQALSEGDLEEAERLAWAAVALFPGQYQAQEVIRVVTTLRDQGFEYRPER